MERSYRLSDFSDALTKLVVESDELSDKVIELVKDEMPEAIDTDDFLVQDDYEKLDRRIDDLDDRIDKIDTPETVDISDLASESDLNDLEEKVDNQAIEIDALQTSLRDLQAKHYALIEKMSKIPFICLFM